MKSSQLSNTKMKYCVPSLQTKCQQTVQNGIYDLQNEFIQQVYPSANLPTTASTTSPLTECIKCFTSVLRAALESDRLQTAESSYICLCGFKINTFSLIPCSLLNYSFIRVQFIEKTLKEQEYTLIPDKSCKISLVSINRHIPDFSRGQTNTFHSA